MIRIPQPPINRLARDSERREMWPGLVLVVVGVMVFWNGMGHLTGVETVEGAGAWEYQLIKAFSSGGLEYVDPAAFPDPAMLADPALAAAAFERLERMAGRTVAFKLRVNTGAVDPCPT